MGRTTQANYRMSGTVTVGITTRKPAIPRTVKRTFAPSGIVECPVLRTGATREAGQ